MNDYGKEQRILATALAGILLCIPLWTITLGMASSARDAAQAELDTRTGLDHWWHSSDPSSAAGRWYLGGLILTAALFNGLYVISPALLDALRNRAAQQQAKKFQESIHKLDSESVEQAKLSGIAQSKQEIVMRLGSIDQFIRVYQGETSPPRRIASLQAAYTEITTLSSKRASGEIAAEAMADPGIVAIANETLIDLDKAGLGDDRIARELRRMFS